MNKFATIGARIDKKSKQEFENFCNSIGVTPSSLIYAFIIAVLRNIQKVKIEEKEIIFSQLEIKVCKKEEQNNEIEEKNYLREVDAIIDSIFNIVRIIFVGYAKELLNDKFDDVEKLRIKTKIYNTYFAPLIQKLKEKDIKAIEELYNLLYKSFNESEFPDEERYILEFAIRDVNNVVGVLRRKFFSNAFYKYLKNQASRLIKIYKKIHNNEYLTKIRQILELIQKIEERIYLTKILIS